MAIDRGAALVVLAVAVTGCTGMARCKSQTVLVTVAFDTAAAVADTVEIDITVAGATKTTSLAHVPNNARGTIEVRFPSGYPAGKSIDVTIIAMRGGNPLGSASQSLLLPAGCATTMLTIDGEFFDMTAPSDLSAPSSDLSAPSSDLSSRSSDMCASTAENCFNGIDDNCDGLVDCADPQCSSGGAPVAQCVPDPGASIAGTLSTDTHCPTAYPTATALHSGLNAGSCSNGSCACANGLNGAATCSAILDQNGGTVQSCNTFFATIFNKTSADGCFAFTALSPATYYTLGTPTYNASCNPPTGGVPMNNAPTWTATRSFCGGAAVGGGCAVGQVCVPAAPNHCVLEMGDQAACSVPGYSVLDTTHLYTGFDDSGRSCACSCTLTGSCPSVVGFGTGNCSLPTAISPGCQKNLSYDHAQVSAPSGAGCAIGASSAGATSTLGFERTVCCMN